MRKRIGVFIGEIAQDYQTIISRAIIERANSLNYDVVFICNYGSYNEDILYADGEKSCINLPDCSTFDGIIVTEDIFDIAGMPDELYEIIKATATCPVVYLRSTRDGYYSIMAENKNSIVSMVRHFTDVHGFTDICYMSGKQGAEDAKERLDGYIEAMNDRDIEVNEHMVFHGDYWRFRGEEALNWFMEGRDTYPQAIICANDYMALSICIALNKRGIRVPEDVAVSGFDFIDEAKLNTPSLTSLEVDFVGMANRAVDIINNVNNGKQEEKLHRISAKLCLQKSCGCGTQFGYQDMIELMSQRQHSIDDTKNTFISVTEYQYSFGFDEFMAVADKHRRFIRSKKAYICFNDASESGSNEVENDSHYTNNMVLKRVFEEKLPAELPDLVFPRKELIPEKYWHEDEPNNFCIFPIHFKNVVYGYCVAEVDEHQWFDIQTQGYFMTLANAIENSNLHQKIEQLESIRTMYQNDPLTGILNRRGIDKKLNYLFQKAKSEGFVIGVASIDMDNLKTLNDTYGHAEGDKALIALTRAMSKALNEDEFCGRVGGDEFIAVINITDENRPEEFKKKFAEQLAAESVLSNVKLPVGASVGICLSSEKAAATMFSCMQMADKRMYDDKRRRKAERK